MNNVSDVKMRGNSAEAVKDFLNNTLRELMSVLNADCGSLFLFDAKNKELVLDSSYKSNKLYLKGVRQKVGEGISGKVASKRVPVLVKDIANDPRFRGNGYAHYNTKSFISIPLFTGQGLLGLINLADKSSCEPFSEKDLKYALSITKYACQVVDGIYDCRALKQEKDELDRQKALLEKYASVGKLASGIVHEINNPLDGIIRYTNMLLEQMEHNSVAREYLLEAKRGLDRIANITRSLLGFSRQVNGHQPLVKKYVHTHDLIDDALDHLLYNLKDVRVERDYCRGLPRVLDLGLSHVITNIVKNAAEAMAGKGTLEIASETNNTGIKISIKDSGRGIPLAIKEQIFEPFFTTKARDKGTGLGLAICNEIISKYDGRINVQSMEGKGSTFTILIPKEYLENA